MQITDKNFAIFISDKILYICFFSLLINNENTNNVIILIKTLVAPKHGKRCLTSLVFMGIQLNFKITNYFTSHRIVKMCNTQCWQGHGIVGTLSLCL